MEALKHIVKKVLWLEHEVYKVEQEHDKSFSKAIVEGLVGKDETKSLIPGVDRPSTFKLKTLVERLRSKTIGFSMFGCNYNIVTTYCPKSKRLTLKGSALGFKKDIDYSNPKLNSNSSPATFSFTLVVVGNYAFQSLETSVVVNKPEEEHRGGYGRKTW